MTSTFTAFKPRSVFSIPNEITSPSVKYRNPPDLMFEIWTKMLWDSPLLSGSSQWANPQPAGLPILVLFPECYDACHGCTSSNRTRVAWGTPRSVMSYSTCCPLTGTHDSVIALLSKRIERSTSSGLSDQIRPLPRSGEYEMIFPVILFHPEFI